MEPGRFSNEPKAAVINSNHRGKLIVNGREFNSLQRMAKEFGISSKTVSYRLSKGWSPSAAVGVDPRPSHAGNTPGIRVKVQELEFSNLRQAAKHFGRSYTYAIGLLKKGRTFEQALGLIKRSDSFQSEFPELAKQWHPNKNAPLTPDQVIPHSGQKVWWLCSNGHEWKAVINSRGRGGHGCPYCAGQKPTADRNFGAKFPEMIKEWDFENNQNLRPEDCSPRSKNNVWWKCEKGHSWQATIGNRTRKWKSSCPFCLNRRLGEDNSLAQLRPDIAKEWHPSKNSPITPNDVLAGGTKKFWWLCKHGHEYQVSIGARVFNGTGCSKCCLQTSRIEIAIYAELVALFDQVHWREKISGYECDIYLKAYDIGVEIDGVYWHSRKPELEMKKSKVFEAAGLQLYRLREKGLLPLSPRDVIFKFSDPEFEVVCRLLGSIVAHANLEAEQQDRLRHYLDGPGLVNEGLYRKLVSQLPAPPPDQSLAAKRPDIAAEWAYDLNAPLSPEHFRSQSTKSVWWRCGAGHTWKTSLNHRVGQGTKCPECPRKYSIVVTAENNFAFFFPNLVREWNYERNGTTRPENIRPHSNHKYWWKCKKNHEWRSEPSSRAAGHGCPYCYGRFASKENNLAAKYPELLKDWDQEKNKGLDPSTFTPHVSKKVWWFCKTGHNWQATIYNRAKNKSGCPKCAQNARRRYSIVDIQKFALSRGGICLTEEYMSCRQQIKLTCNEGHTWRTRADSLIYTEKWCPECGIKLSQKNRLVKKTNHN